MTLYYVSEIDLQSKTREHTRYFKIDLPVAIGEGYTQVVSWNAFFHGTRRRNRNEKYLYHPVESDFFTPIKDVPIVNVESVWDMYEKISYNHKKKTYTTP